MSNDHLVRIPYFVIPADDERSVLFAKRHTERQVRVQLFDGSDEKRRFTLDVYFGTVLVWPTDDDYNDDLLAGVAAACNAKSESDECVIRLDYAYDCLSKRFELLRVGLPKSVPIPYSDLEPDVVRNAERYIERFMQRPHIDILAERLQVIGDESILFESEETFLEGFLGESGLPLALPTELEALIKCATESSK